MDTPYPKFTEGLPMMNWGKAWFPEASRFLSKVTETSLSGPTIVPWAAMVEKKVGRSPAATTLGDTVLQVAMHSQYHRGQINARLKELGSEPPLVDYIVWIWCGKPAAQWPREG